MVRLLMIVGVSVEVSALISQLATQVDHISHVLQMINTAARLVRVHLDFCTSWGQTQ